MLINSVTLISCIDRLQTIISKGMFTIDFFFIICIIRDLAEVGPTAQPAPSTLSMLSIHRDLITSTGHSLVPLEISRLHHALSMIVGKLKFLDLAFPFTWIVKNRKVRKDKERQHEFCVIDFLESLWVAAEHLAEDPVGESKQGDVYSFAIVCSEVITRKPAWNIAERSETTHGSGLSTFNCIVALDVPYFIVHLDLIYRIKRGGHTLIRPELALAGVEISSSLVSDTLLIR